MGVRKQGTGYILCQSKVTSVCEEGPGVLQLLAGPYCSFEPKNMTGAELSKGRSCGPRVGRAASVSLCSVCVSLDIQFPCRCMEAEYVYLSPSHPHLRMETNESQKDVSQLRKSGIVSTTPSTPRNPHVCLELVFCSA